MMIIILNKENQTLKKEIKGLQEELAKVNEPLDGQNY